jgi:hypothetical protein
MFNRRIFAAPPPAGVTISTAYLDELGEGAVGATIGLGGVGIADQGLISGDLGIGTVNAVYSVDEMYRDNQQILLSGTSASAVSTYLSGFTAIVIYYMGFPIYSLPVSRASVGDEAGFTFLVWAEPEILFIPNEEFTLVLE